MADTQPAATPAPAPAPKARKQRSETTGTLVFLLKLAVLVFVIRSFIFSPFSIPSESMLPRLYIGDYLFVSKWNYGYSKHSLPFSLPLIPGRIFSHLPDRGDVIVFKAPPQDKQDYIKRVIGLPGDTIQMRAGQVILNGTPVPRVRIADFVIPQSPNYHCDATYEDVDAAGAPVCRYRRYRETLPNGKSFDTIDRGFSPADNTGVYTVPADHVFMMGDNRDDSEDSRFSQEAGGIGYVPMANLEGKAILTFWSTDGSAAWLKPWTWITAARWSRIGDGF